MVQWHNPTRLMKVATKPLPLVRWHHCQNDFTNPRPQIIRLIRPPPAQILMVDLLYLHTRPGFLDQAPAHSTTTQFLILQTSRELLDIITLRPTHTLSTTLVLTSTLILTMLYSLRPCFHRLKIMEELWPLIE